ncbi:hypothetical protein [Laspinema olomoucense]|uniref:Uncharacterized protein n=1 Tax=Laspinema olomoucense D3b TaxID=2953688 RepID=A0ABT2NDE7_9CYAN|nr:hypothetical protein [Laspinema sp. D3b]MCT7980725.1 hypothetical protein [Laspinema sp. D3b]
MRTSFLLAIEINSGFSEIYVPQAQSELKTKSMAMACSIDYCTCGSRDRDRYQLPRMA